MSATNHTTNYDLSQFEQTDKPAWLGDYNQDMSKIDTAIKGNADEIVTTNGNVTTLGETVTSMQSSITSNTNDISDLKSTTATHTTDISNLEVENQTQQQQIERIAQIFTLTSEQQTGSNLLNGKITGGGIGGAIYLAQSPDSTLYKFYGNLTFNASASGETLTLIPVPGLTGNYGLKTSLHLTIPPSSAYSVTGCGLKIKKTASGVNDITTHWFCVGTDGYIYIFCNTTSSIYFAASSSWLTTFDAQLYINADLGDINQ